MIAMKGVNTFCQRIKQNGSLRPSTRFDPVCVAAGLLGLRLGMKRARLFCQMDAEVASLN